MPRIAPDAPLIATTRRLGFEVWNVSGVGSCGSTLDLGYFILVGKAKNEYGMHFKSENQQLIISGGMRLSNSAISSYLLKQISEIKDYNVDSTCMRDSVRV